MKPLGLLIVCFVLTLVGLAVFTAYDGSASATQVGGMPVVALGADKGAWIAFGGVGVLVLGAGIGVVSLGICGGGILIGTGQLAGGLIALGQAGLGVLLFLGQVGFGLQVGAQGGLGWRRWTQGNNRDEAYFRSMWGELSEVLSPRSKGRSKP